GRYSTGEYGSPVIAIEHASIVANNHPGFRAEIICIDKDQEKLDYLLRLPSVMNRHKNIELHVFQGTFESRVRGIFEKLNIPERTPAFCFIDPFGFGESPYELIRPLVRNDSTELVINFWCGFMNRFKEHPNPQIPERIKGMVGSNNLDRVINSGNPISELCDVYQETLSQIGKFTLRFMMLNEKNQPDNALFFCGNNTRGFQKIKEAMWKIDPVNGCGFSALNEVTASTQDLFGFVNEPDSHQLGIMLMEEFRGQKITVEELEKWTVEKTETYHGKHLRKELERLYSQDNPAQRKINYFDPKQTGRKRSRGHWPVRLVIEFIG
ncbi:MAG TPA: three-Cys-motif partner protein TcmP, partial [Rhodospirillales bacterium]|nr:three-Cys-motif partner protein TcmP [Rhodospirillales bacterium]